MAKQKKRPTRAEKIAAARVAAAEAPTANPEFKSVRSAPLLDRDGITLAEAAEAGSRSTLSLPVDGDTFQCACVKCEHFSNQQVRWKTIETSWACEKCGTITVYKGRRTQHTRCSLEP